MDLARSAGDGDRPFPTSRSLPAGPFAIQKASAYDIILECETDVASDVVAGSHGQQDGVIWLADLHLTVHPGDQKRQPADAAFGHHPTQCRVALEHSAEHHVGDRSRGAERRSRVMGVQAAPLRVRMGVPAGWPVWLQSATPWASASWQIGSQMGLFRGSARSNTPNSTARAPGPISRFRTARQVSGSCVERAGR